MKTVRSQGCATILRKDSTHDRGLGRTVEDEEDEPTTVAAFVARSSENSSNDVAWMGVIRGECRVASKIARCGIDCPFKLKWKPRKSLWLCTLSPNHNPIHIVVPAVYLANYAPIGQESDY